MSMNREFAKGLAKAKENDFIAAIEHFSNAIAEDKKVDYYAERAVAYLNSNQFELSLFDMNICIEMEPNNSYRYSCRAFLKSRMGDPDGAITDYEKAVQLDPEDAIAYNNLGLAQEQKGYLEKAKRSFNRSNELIGYDPDKSARRLSETVHEKPVKEPENEPQPRRSQVAKEVFTTRSGFRDFLRFIRNGFKIKP